MRDGLPHDSEWDGVSVYCDIESQYLFNFLLADILTRGVKVVQEILIPYDPLLCSLSLRSNLGPQNDSQKNTYKN